ncbi:MAG: transcriptional repressor [Bacteroidaceae bacterium]|jgi:Fur family ferric uptake transcriptional regulator|nr:transcriptional repressor [Bacteroidaceae bacterium]MBP3832367.1 transcriptional repressor [Bacteroidaceae bacterium]MBQ8485547.1 transcriptional repressor [Bacteroidaceae bacterium]MBQ9675017.1 transcriptional repressor [Bacteroidaceae bacterium]
MDEAKSIEILLEHGIRPTANRLLLVKVLSKAEHPLTMKELEDLVDTIDKSNIFRTLSLFRDQHLVHVLQDGADAVRYELCHSHEEDHDDDLHAHFYCERCRQTFCLNDIPVPQVDLPKGYRMNTINYLIKGICPNCQ